jgi:hypothetical protein
MSANTVAENIFAQVDEDGHQEVLFSEIIGHWTDGSEVPDSEAFVKSANGVQRQKETTRGWEINIEWKYGGTTWHKLKDAKDSYPVYINGGYRSF